MTAHFNKPGWEEAANQETEWTVMWAYMQVYMLWGRGQEEGS